MSLGQPPSPCFSACDVMRTQIPREHKSPELSARLDAFRMAVMFLAESEIRTPGAISELQSSLTAPDAKPPAFLEGVDEGLRGQAFHCAGEVAQGNCRVLDIVVNDVNGVAGYTTNDTTVSIFKAIRAETEEPPKDYDVLDNARYVVDEQRRVQKELIETPPPPTREEKDDALREAFAELARRLRRPRF